MQGLKSLTFLVAVFSVFIAGAMNVRTFYADTVPGPDYNGNQVTIRLMVDSPVATTFTLTLNGKTYGPVNGELSPGQIKAVFTVDGTGPNAVMAGNAYSGTVKAQWQEQDKTRTFPLAIWLEQYETKKEWIDWFWSYSQEELAVPGEFVPPEEMPTEIPARVDASFVFEEASDDDPDDYPENAQAAVRIVEDGAGGYKFQFFSAQAVLDDDKDEIVYYIGWWDANVGTFKPEIGEEYTIRMEAYYDADVRYEQNTLVIWVKKSYANQFTRLFLGIPFNYAKEWVGESTHLSSVAFEGRGTVTALEGYYEEETQQPIQVAKIGGVSGRVATNTVAAAVEALPRQGGTICLLHAATWAPSVADMDRAITFENKSWLYLTVPEGYEAKWRNVQGNKGTLFFRKKSGFAVIIGSMM